jgi:hypothetical protein
MRRIFTATISFEGLMSKGEAPIPFETTTRISGEYDLWFLADRSGERRTYSFENRATLSSEFWADLVNFPLPVDLRVVRALLDSPANLDFYVWLRNKACRLRMGRFLKVPLQGTHSVSEQLAAARYAQPRNFRTKIRRWLDRTKALWPDCPAVLSSNGAWLIIGHTPIVHHPQAAPFLSGRRFKSARA